MGDYDLIKLSTSVIQGFIIFKTEQGSLLIKQKLSYNTVNLITSVLKQALKYAFKFDLITKDITINISLPKQLIPYLKQIKKSSSSKYIISTRKNDMVSIRSYQRTYMIILKKSI